MRKRELLSKFDKLMNILIGLSRVFPKSIHKCTLKLVRNWDSLLGILRRYMCLKNLCKKCGDNVAIFSGVYLMNPEGLEIGNNISIHPMCYIDATGLVSIGDNVSIAHSTTIMSTEHIYCDKDTSIKDQGLIKKQTVIADNVWVGAGCRILAGSKINRGAIIAAGAVVKNEIVEFSIVGGIPAKIIKER